MRSVSSEVNRGGMALWTRLLVVAVVGMALSIAHSVGGQEDPFAAQVRPTEPLSPEAERESFELPDGFSVQLFASEPRIGKPLNMAFDEEGRLWVTQSREYPHPAPLDEPGRDKIKILEDTDRDGRADKVTTFATGLNIPIGLYPYRNGVIAWSIPNIWYFEDLDGDDKADEKRKLYGPLGWRRDTHGMNSSFTRGFDGWLYITHGFNNQTTVSGTDGHEITMHSGNTYRVRLDGSRVEHYTWGQVNPFGLCFDPEGNLYSADCHSSPIYQLLQGGYYPSFGKPHDGLGFAPSLMRHDHGSTAISGIVYYADNLWPTAYRDNVFVGNVMTSRVNRDQISFSDSTPTAKKRPDLARTADPWFRPVNMQLGPDGALYVADFYNRVIGHYEVPLDHPGRDHKRGRIWRIVYEGPDDEAELHGRLDLPNASVSEVIEELGHPNLTRRMLATHYLTDSIGRRAVGPLCRELEESENAFQQVHGLWALSRLGALEPARLAAAAQASDATVRVHAMRILTEVPEWTDLHARLARQGLTDDRALTRRAAAKAIGQHPRPEHVRPLLDALHAVPTADTHLSHMIRIALRNQLRLPASYAQLPLSQWTEADAEAVASVSLAVDSSEAASFLLSYVAEKDEIPEERVRDYLRHSARYLPRGALERMVAVTRARFRDQVDIQLTLFRAVETGLDQRGLEASESIRKWGRDLAGRLLASVDTQSIGWVNRPVPKADDGTNPWLVEPRRSADGDAASRFLSSLSPGGEQFTGILQSKPFRIPGKLSFYMAGHDGYPDKPRYNENEIRLRLSETDEVVAGSPAPRQDVAKELSWDLAQWQGKTGYLEIVDANDEGAYAWIAVGRITPNVAGIPSISPREIPRQREAAARLAGRLRLKDLAPELVALLKSEKVEMAPRAAAAEALLRINPAEHLPSVANLFNDVEAPSALRMRLAKALGAAGTDASLATLAKALTKAPGDLQEGIALALASREEGGRLLLDAIEEGRASARLLTEKAVQDRLQASQPKSILDRVDQLTPPDSQSGQDRAKLVAKRFRAFDRRQASLTTGRELFRQYCVACHQIDGEGGMIGPQLDGIGSRGVKRLMEDILDPNRNVDDAFRYSTIRLKNGEIKTGLFRRKEGARVVFASMSGDEFSIQASRIDERNQSTRSLMPDNFAELLDQRQLDALIRFLLDGER